MMTIRSTMLLAGAILALNGLPLQAMPLPSVALPMTPSAPVISVRGHGHGHGHGHWHHGHRRDHRFHGRDDYYDRDDQSGVLFKSFITGTLFR